MQYKTIKVRKTYVFAAIFFVIVAVTVFMIQRTFTEYMAGNPDPITDYSGMELIQLEPPPENAKTAKITTSAGEMTMVLYETEAPNACALFSSTAANGGYNGLSAELYEMGSVFTLDAPYLKNAYRIELHKNLWPFKGAVCMTSEGDLVFVNTVEFSEEEREYLTSESEALPEVRAAFLNHGGVPNFTGQYAVFGQITEGIEVLEAIAPSPADTVITIESITVTATE